MPPPLPARSSAGLTLARPDRDGNDPTLGTIPLLTHGHCASHRRCDMLWGLGSVKERRPSVKSPRRLTSEESSVLEDVLLIGETSPEKRVSGDVDPATRERWDRAVSAGAEKFEFRRTTSHSVQVGQGRTLKPADLLTLDEKQRVALLNNVKRGRMSVDEALEEVRHVCRTAAGHAG